MGKTKKVLGIGVTVLIVFMALTPFVSANSDSTQTSESSKEAREQQPTSQTAEEEAEPDMDGDE